MAAEILEAQPEELDLDQLPADQTAMSPEALITEFSSPDTVEAPPPEADPLPEKYNGKSIKEVVAMHQEAEKLIGTQGSEVGELRKVVDTYINSQLESQATAPEPKEPAPDFFEDPEKAVSHAIENHTEVVHARQAAQQMYEAELDWLNARLERQQLRDADAR